MHKFGYISQGRGLILKTFPQQKRAKRYFNSLFFLLTLIVSSLNRSKFIQKDSFWDETKSSQVKVWCRPFRNILKRVFQYKFQQGRSTGVKVVFTSGCGGGWVFFAIPLYCISLSLNTRCVIYSGLMQTPLPYTYW